MDLAKHGLRVKPLEWNLREDRGIWTAKGIFGASYTVSDSQWLRNDLSAWVWVDGGDEAAKSAADANYESGVISALAGETDPNLTQPKLVSGGNS